MSFIQDAIANNPITDTINNTMSFLGLSTKQQQSILIDATVCPFDTDLILYDKNGLELLRLREVQSFDIPVDTVDSATPSGKRQTKGIIIGCHTITVNNVVIPENYIDNKGWVGTASAKLTQARSLCGIFAPEISDTVTKGQELLTSIYATANSVATITSMANDIKNSFTGDVAKKRQQMQTLIENLTLHEDNGNYSVAYCGKKYHKMALINPTIENNTVAETVQISATFKYCPETDTTELMAGSNVKGWNIAKQQGTVSLQGEEQTKTLLKSMMDSAKSFMLG